MKLRVRKVVSLISPTFRYINIYIYIYVYIYIYIYIYINIYIYICMCVCMYVCMYVDIVLISLCLQTPGSERVHLSFFIKGSVFVRVIAVSCFT